MLTKLSDLEERTVANSFILWEEYKDMMRLVTQFTGTAHKPEVWTRTLFDYKRMYDQRTNTTKTQTVGTLGAEDVYELPFNEKNLKELFAKRESDTQISFTVKDEGRR